MPLNSSIDQDLKTALLSGDKLRATTLRSLKSAIVYAEVAEGARQTGLSDVAIISVISQQSKKRQESADIYLKAGATARANQELAEKQIIDNYLPAQLTEPEINKFIDDAMVEMGSDKPAMGQIIALVKQKTVGKADGAVIARLVKDKL
ncbi:MAG: GatB/YqeY domain-containing protein [Candidatus Saccharimonadales bacterium]